MAVLGSYLASPPERLAGTRLSTGAGGAVALTFDDGPSPSTTPTTLDLLDTFGLRATFFLRGEAVAAAPKLALEIAERGHEVASHGMVHAHHLLRSPRWVLADTAAAIAGLTELGLRPRFYRPPFGQVSAATLRGAAQAGCEVVLWSIWGREFADRRTEAVLGRLCRGLRPGAIVLLHDSDACCPPGSAQRAQAVLPGVARRLDEQGLTTAPLRELLG